MQFEVEGAKELRRAMKRAGLDVKDLKMVHRQIADTVVSRAKGGAPVRSGRLRDSIRPGATQTAAIVRAGEPRCPTRTNPLGLAETQHQAQPFLVEAAHDTETNGPSCTPGRRDIIETIERTTP